MLTYPALAKLEQDLRERTVLSVYLNGEGADSSTRTRWRADLRHSLDDIESWLRDSSHGERESFAARRRLVLERLDGIPGEIGAPGWVGFFTDEGSLHEGAVPVPVPTMAVWSTGACVAPYIRVLKETRPVIAAIVDSKQARLFRYVDRSLQVLDTLTADVDIELARHMGRPSAQGFHTGTRGPTGTDAAQAVLQKATERLLAETGSRIAALAAGDAWIVIGGIPTVAATALTRLAPALAGCAMRADLDVHASDSRIAECARRSASQLRDADDLSRINRTIAASEANGAGVTGSVESKRALDEGRARELYFTLRYLANHAADVEAAVRSAFDHGTVVEQVSGVAAERLDAVGGVAAYLRFAAAGEAVASSARASSATPR
ncbi:MAG TPA: hypothetical protein VF981_05945 [Gemmatimonadaceae bacterium]